ASCGGESAYLVADQHEVIVLDQYRPAGRLRRDPLRVRAADVLVRSPAALETAAPRRRVGLVHQAVEKKSEAGIAGVVIEVPVRLRRDVQQQRPDIAVA